ncbi:hypothetical protein [Actinacidiphila acididurans]|uniref:Uncharacterized protein n=1 Tax=Actinacidiphila acididurans TaxID=2784346 RepID=A0ABS2TUJ8_9ACTN|nr:hypothetical protein [Actinacidiphila acididurans]MBM9506757.1 hypothetical protein [Actinacidiphila acididurans]
MAPTFPKQQVAGHLPGYLPPADLPTVPHRRTPTAASADIVLERHESVVGTARQYVTAAPGASDGPVFHRPGEFGPGAGYTVLLPASAARIWWVHGTVVLPPAVRFVIPTPDRLEPTMEAPWWVVPLDGPDRLCTSALLASLLARPTTAVGGEDSHA